RSTLFPYTTLFRSPAERPGLRRTVVRQGGDAGRHSRDVVAVGARPWLRLLADDRAPRLALRRGAGRLLRRLAAMVRRHRPADVLLLRRHHGTVFGDGDRADLWRHPLQTSSRRRRPHARTDRRILLRRTGADELRVAVSGADRSADFADHLEHGDLAAQLAVTDRIDIALKAVGPRLSTTLGAISPHRRRDGVSDALARRGYQLKLHSGS